MAGSFRVDQGNVLQAHAAVQAAADKIREVVQRRGRDMQLGVMGGDPVSAEAAVAFTERLQRYVTFSIQYADELERLASALRRAALEYGYADEDIARGFPSAHVDA